MSALPSDVPSDVPSVVTAEDSLAADKRQATVDRILQAARHLIGEQGIDITMDEIAEGAGVGRRTVFRHFASRDALLAAAIESGIRRYGEQLPVYSGGDWHEWLGQMCQAMHRLNGNYGRGYWELTSRHDLEGELAAAEARRRASRRTAMERLAATIWGAAGGAGPVPSAVVATVTVHLSAHFTAAVVHEAGLGWADAARLAESAIATELEQLLESQTV